MAAGEMIINGASYRVSANQTILDVATENGIRIPTLCHLKGASSTGTCGICVVAVEDRAELVPACTTPAANNMVVLTESKRVVAARKQTLSRLLSSGNHNCAIGSSAEKDWAAFQVSTFSNEGEEALCPAWGDCRLQDLAYQYQVAGGIGRKGDPLSFPRPVTNIPMIVRDFSRCIRCGRCVKACNEIQVNGAIRFDFPDIDTDGAFSGEYPAVDENCVYCGECVQACPVGALVDKKARYQLRTLETQTIRTTCPYCGVGCQQLLHVREGKIVKVTGVEDAQPNKGRLCVKGRFGYDFIYSPERLTDPLIKDNGVFRKASWDEALDLVANTIKKIIAEDGPSAVAGVSCARSINEDSYQMQKLFRSVFKTNNIDHCART
jgi:formate dehydrogenase major subunit